MTPTTELRFVERWDTDEVTHDTRTIRVLQQKWQGAEEKWVAGDVLMVWNEEWRDVPLVKEE